jgi:hypothetical protein
MLSKSPAVVSKNATCRRFMSRRYDDDHEFYYFFVIFSHYEQKAGRRCQPIPMKYDIELQFIRV